MGISTDEVEDIAIFANKHRFPFPLLSDIARQICVRYGACAPANDGQAQRITYVIGPDGHILREYLDVNPNGHAEEILAFLDRTTQFTLKSMSPPEHATIQACLYENITEERRVKMSDKLQAVENIQSQVPLHTVREIASDSLLGHKVESEVAPGSFAVVPTVQVVASQDTKLPQVIPSASSDSQKPLVYALGTLGIDFVSEARRDSIQQHMGDNANPYDHQQLLNYLDENPWDAAAITWTLSLDATPIYTIQPQGAYAEHVYTRLCKFLNEQLEEHVERISIPGVITGKTMLTTGQVVPTILPALRSMYSWTTSTLVETLCDGKKDNEVTIQGIENFLERVYYEIRNLGVTPQERAINYAATNAFNIERIFESALQEEIDLEVIEVERSPLCRPDSDCWDVKLTFFHPEKVFEQARKVYRFTVDVSDVCPVTVGRVRSWFIR